MSVPLWVPWVLVLALAWPVVVLLALSRRGDGAGAAPARPSGAILGLLLVPASVMAAVAVTMTVDRLQVGQDELAAAAQEAARTLDGSLGPVDADRVAALVADELGRDVQVERSQLSAPDAGSASYEIEVRVSEEDAEPAACVAVALQVLTDNATGLRFADVSARSGACG